MKLSRKIFVTCLFALASMSAMAQQTINVVGFQLKANDPSAMAKEYDKLRDEDGKRFALIKVIAPQEGFTYDAGAMRVHTERKMGEDWVFVPRRTLRLTIGLAGFQRFTYRFAESLEPGKVYEMLIDLGGGTYYHLDASVPESQVYVDGKYVGKSPVHNVYLYYGPHRIRAVNGQFEGETSVEVKEPEDGSKGQTSLIRVEMIDQREHFGDVVITCEDKDAEIWFDGEKKAVKSWKTSLREGNYVVETRRKDCDPVKTTFTVIAQQENQVKATKPEPHQGILSVYTRPRNVMAVIDGRQEVNFAETRQVRLTVGRYEVEFSRKGYQSQTKPYIIRREVLTTDTVELARTEYVKPLAFYFGAGFTVRTLSGVTGMLGAVFHRHDIQASYTFGLAGSDPVHWYTSDGNYTYQSSSTYKMSSLAIKYGYQFNLSYRLAITPQVGVSIDQLSGTLDNGSTLYADGASATCATVGVKLLLVPMQHFYVFAAPEFAIGVKKDNNFDLLSNASNISAGGFGATLGLIFNF